MNRTLMGGWIASGATLLDSSSGTHTISKSRIGIVVVITEEVGVLKVLFKVELMTSNREAIVYLTRVHFFEESLDPR